MKNIKYHFYKSVESTMYTAKSIIPEIHDEHIHCVVSESQTSGIGQRANKWHSPAGNLYSTYIIPKHMIVGNEKKSLFAFSTAFAEHISKDHLIDIKLKWPNDFIVNDSKVGGMICEICDKFVIVGIGININCKVANMSYYETTTLSNYNYKLTPKQLITDVEPYILEKIKTLKNSWNNIRNDWEKHSYGVGNKFSFKTPNNETKNGIFLGISDDGYAKFLMDNKINIFHTISNMIVAL